MITRVLTFPHFKWLAFLVSTAIAFPIVWPPLGMEHQGAVCSLVMLSIFLAATISSIAGFAFSAIAGASLLHLIDDPVEAVKVMIASSIAIQSYSVVAIWRTIDWQRLAPFLLGGALTIPAGIYLVLNASAGTYWNGMGAFLVLYALIMLFRGGPATYRGSVIVDVVTGALGGITGGAAGFPGAFVTIWCGMRGWDKNRQRAVYQPFILIMQLLTLLALEVSGAGQSYDISLMEYAPAALLGAYCGLSIFKRLNDRHFNIAIYVLLIISGIALVAK
jgi:uncharacterized membrane protein YfcA